MSLSIEKDVEERIKKELIGYEKFILSGKALKIFRDFIAKVDLTNKKSFKGTMKRTLIQDCVKGSLDLPSCFLI